MLDDMTSQEVIKLLEQEITIFQKAIDEFKKSLEKDSVYTLHWNTESHITNSKILLKYKHSVEIIADAGDDFNIVGYCKHQLKTHFKQSCFKTVQSTTSDMRLIEHNADMKINKIVANFYATILDKHKVDLDEVTMYLIDLVLY